MMTVWSKRGYTLFLHLRRLGERVFERHWAKQSGASAGIRNSYSYSGPLAKPVSFGQFRSVFACGSGVNAKAQRRQAAVRAMQQVPKRALHMKIWTLRLFIPRL
jgi:hypothetical protein